jgi:hypothetical protein
VPGSDTAEHFENVVGSYRFFPLRACADGRGYGFATRNIRYPETSSQVSPHTTVSAASR